jgi:hypothetical protein
MQGWKEPRLVGPHIMELMDIMFWYIHSSNWENSVASFGIGYWHLTAIKNAYLQIIWWTNAANLLNRRVQYFAENTLRLFSFWVCFQQTLGTSATNRVNVVIRRFVPWRISTDYAGWILPEIENRERVNKQQRIRFSNIVLNTVCKYVYMYFLLILRTVIIMSVEITCYKSPPPPFREFNITLNESNKWTVTVTLFIYTV